MLGPNDAGCCGNASKAWCGGVQHPSDPLCVVGKELNPSAPKGREAVLGAVWGKTKDGATAAPAGPPASGWALHAGFYLTRVTKLWELQKII